MDLLGPKLFDALRKYNREMGAPLVRSWEVEARHTLLYVSQDAASLRTSLLREDFTDVLLAVELEHLISQLVGLRDAIAPVAREAAQRVTMTESAGPMHNSGPVDQSQVALTRSLGDALNLHAHSHEGEFDTCTREQCVAVRQRVASADA